MVRIAKLTLLARWLCRLLRVHRWEVVARSDRHDRMRDLHPLAGCLAHCVCCGSWWDDLPGATQRVSFGGTRAESPRLRASK